jgi:xanthine dehydrogenase iron-sulfur cluster and FAD-binding subunit A
MAVIRDVMPAFELVQPGSVADAQKILERRGSDAWVLAGGMDSFDWLKDRIKRPSVVVDLSGIAELKGIRTTADGLEIGAMTTLTEIVNHDVVRQQYGLLGRRRNWSRRRRSAIRARSAATCRRTHAAGITGPAGPATAPAATSVMPTRRYPAIANTQSSTPAAAWR